MGYFYFLKHKVIYRHRGRLVGSLPIPVKSIINIAILLPFADIRVEGDLKKHRYGSHATDPVMTI
jgi:hypothetical protein